MKLCWWSLRFWLQHASLGRSREHFQCPAKCRMLLFLVPQYCRRLLGHSWVKSFCITSVRFLNSNCAKKQKHSSECCDKVLEGLRQVHGFNWFCGDMILSENDLDDTFIKGLHRILLPPSISSAWFATRTESQRKGGSSGDYSSEKLKSDVCNETAKKLRTEALKDFGLYPLSSCEMAFVKSWCPQPRGGIESIGSKVSSLPIPSEAKCWFFDPLSFMLPPKLNKKHNISHDCVKWTKTIHDNAFL